ncbi:MAG: alpha/beta hydrolase-fold protein [Paralcaligenes sp.]
MTSLAIKTCLALAVACLSTSAAAGEVVSDKLDSAVLGRSLPFTIYLPDGYYDAFDKFPVVYLLHGSGGDERVWTTFAGVRETLDGLIRRREIAPLIAVMPAGGSSWWVDGQTEKIQTALKTELIPYIEKHYEAKSDRRHRAVAGISMGGFGALNLALKHPDLVCAAGLLSPAVYVEPASKSSAHSDTGQFAKGGQFDPALWSAQSYPALLASYKAQKQIVPMYISSGDHDKEVTPAMSANLFEAINTIQPTQVKLRIVDGAHDWLTFRDALPKALKYIDSQCDFQARQIPTK